MTRSIIILALAGALSACSLTDWLSDRQRDQQYRTNQGALEYLNAKKAQERAR